MVQKTPPFLFADLGEAGADAGQEVDGSFGRRGQVHQEFEPWPRCKVDFAEDRQDGDFQLLCYHLPTVTSIHNMPHIYIYMRVIHVSYIYINIYIY